MAKTNKELQEEVTSLDKSYKRLVLKLIKTELELEKAEDIIENLEWEYKHK